MKALLNATVDAILALSAHDRIYKVGEVPPGPLTPYCVVGMDTGAPRNYRMGQASSSDFHRITIQVFAKSSDGVADTVAVVKAAMRRKILVAAGTKNTPCKGETAGNVTRDKDAGGILGCLLTYTFTSSPA